MPSLSISHRPFMNSGIPLFFYCLLLCLCEIGNVHAQNTDVHSTHVLLEQAKHLEAAQRYGDAIPLYREILLRDPENDNIRAALARLLSWQGIYAEAVELYRDVIRRHPVDLELRTALARVLSWQKHMPEAQTLYEGVLQEDPHHAEALQGLADVFLWEGRSAEALLYYERAYAVSKDSTVAERIASIRSTMAQQEQISSTPTESPVSEGRDETLARARAWERAAEYGQAIATYRQALAERPEDDEIRGDLARVLAGRDN
ncbi:MAG: tetratricopeptide repeat protein [Nitrospira sp.]|nr:tetratricopeptide repeat protein [Nitrospira sp.]